MLFELIFFLVLTLLTINNLLLCYEHFNLLNYVFYLTFPALLNISAGALDELYIGT